MPQVAFRLNKESIQTKKGRKWNARAVRDILTNTIYIGKYRVAGVNNHVEKYRIVKDYAFNEANKTMLRYKIDKADKPSMQKDRRVGSFDYRLVS